MRFADHQRLWRRAGRHSRIGLTRGTRRETPGHSTGVTHGPFRSRPPPLACEGISLRHHAARELQRRLAEHGIVERALGFRRQAVLRNVHLPLTVHLFCRACRESLRMIRRFPVSSHSARPDTSPEGCRCAAANLALVDCRDLYFTYSSTLPHPISPFSRRRTGEPSAVLLAPPSVRVLRRRHLCAPALIGGSVAHRAPLAGALHLPSPPCGSWPRRGARPGWRSASLASPGSS